MFDLWTFVFAFGTSLLLCAIALARPEWFLNREHMISDLSAKQAQHTRPTPRVGGAAVIIAVVLAGALVVDQLGHDLIWALLAGLIVFAVGFREDILRDVSPKMRLLAAFAAGAAAVAVTGQTVPGLGLVQTDYLFGWVGVGLLVTLLWSAGSCHALNLIDGLNGLASGYTICAAFGFWVIAGYTGDTDIQSVAGILIAAVLGFFVLNWPLGRIFMGDAGAYAIGHVLAWLGILLMARNPEVAGFAVLLIMFWPVGDTIFSMIRRRLRRKATDQPDRLHFHHLIVRALPLALRRGLRKSMDNSVATIVIVPLFAAPIIAGVWFWDDGLEALFLLMFFTMLFMGTYAFSIDYFASRRFRRHEGRRVVQIPGMAGGAELSWLSGIYVQDATAIDVRIARAGPEAPWTLITSAAGVSDLYWDGEFETDMNAWQAFLRVAEDQGMRAVMGRAA
jgi:UDP-GlcNAc:undecaprenyl-phosphate GlcNAc-1-phosphate transferase